MGLTNFPNGIASFGVPVLGNVSGIPFTGHYWFVDPLNGLDGNSGHSSAQAFQTLYQAQNAAVADRNDVVVLMGSGDTTGTARLSTANAQTITPASTTGTLNWAKNAVHLIGETAPTAVSSRARIAPQAGTYTQATFGSGNFVNVTASGCFFSNFSLFNGFSTGGVNQICWTENGGRNAYSNVDFGGCGDAASANDAGSMSLLCTGTSGENTFYQCNFGLDTVARTAANSTIQFANHTPRNSFEGCTFISYLTGSGSGALVCSAGAGGLDRWTRFTNCEFINSVKSASATAMAQAFSLNAGAAGLISLNNPMAVGITHFETSSSGLLYINGVDSAGNFAAAGISVNS